MNHTQFMWKEMNFASKIWDPKVRRQLASPNFRLVTLLIRQSEHNKYFMANSNTLQYRCAKFKYSKQNQN